MDLSNYLLMKTELSLVVVLLILMIYDLFASDGAKKYYFPVACIVFLIHTVACFFYNDSGTAFAGMYITGPAQNMIKNILNVGVFLIFLQANGWLSKPDAIVKRGEFFMLTVLTLLGMYIMISSGHLLLFYIGLETASLPIAALVAFDKQIHKSAEAGAKYMFTAIFSSAVMIFGMSFLYGACGTLYYTGIASSIVSTPLVVMGAIFLMSGLFFKISLVPFHLWTADTYEGAPTSVTLYLSTISKTAALFALMMILYIALPMLSPMWKQVIAILIFLTITVGNLFALRQKNVKRFLAFSSVSQAGYAMLGAFAGTAEGMAATIYFMFVYVFSNIAIFGIVNAVEDKTGKVGIDDYNGLYKTNPKLALGMMFALFSLAGIPFFAGFFSKLFVFMSAMEQGYVVLVFLALLNTVISLFYYLLIVKAMFIKDTNTPIDTLKTDGYLKTSLVISMVGIFVIGFIACIQDHISLISFGFQ